MKRELTDPDTPALVRNWIADLPGWLEVHPTSRPDAVADLGAGETAAITLAVELHADLLLMDDRRGVMVALHKGLTVTGTMGLLARAANQRLLDLADLADVRQAETNKFSLPSTRHGRAVS